MSLKCLHVYTQPTSIEFLQILLEFVKSWDREYKLYFFFSVYFYFENGIKKREMETELRHYKGFGFPKLNIEVILIPNRYRTNVICERCTGVRSEIYTYHIHLLHAEHPFVEAVQVPGGKIFALCYLRSTAGYY